jgi:serine phosphatase RsbU (regulator of sigma subunit)
MQGYDVGALAIVGETTESNGAVVTDAVRHSSADAAIQHILRESHLNHPERLPELIAEGAIRLGAAACVLYLVDYEQLVLIPLPVRRTDREAVSVDGSLAGRAFRTVELVESSDDRNRRLWLPLLDGLERLGVMEVAVDDARPLTAGGRETWALLAHLAAELLVTNNSYTDAFEWARRQKPMQLATEMQRDLIPPMTFGTDRVIISGLLAPAYEVGGDCFDYAMNGDIAHVAVFDAVGHGLVASQLSALAVACYRNARIAGLGLTETALAIDEVIAGAFGPERFVTALLGQLDVQSGVLHFVNAGHPEPMLIRDGRVVKELAGEPNLPLGLNALTDGDGAALAVREEDLEPGDRLLLMTDGVDEARNVAGEFFGRQRLAEFAARESASGLPTPEVMRRLHHAILTHQDGELQDDATTLFVEWCPGREGVNVPDTT